MKELTGTHALRTGVRIRERRLDQGIRQADLAADVGISASYLNLIEHNRRRIGGTLLGDIARALGVEPSQLTEGAERAVLDQLRAAGAAFAEAAPELAKAEEMASRYPGWAALIAAQARRLAGVEAQAQMLTDRMAHDPALATSLHAVISTVTSIRSTASILTSDERIDADWQERFHRNIHDDAVRLASASEALMAYLETPEDAPGLIQTPLEEVESWLSAHRSAVATLSDATAIDGLMEAAAGLRAPAQSLLGDHLRRIVTDQAALPEDVLASALAKIGPDPFHLAADLQAEPAVVMRRLAHRSLTEGHAPLGLAVCDAGGFLLHLQEAPDFAMPRGAACPLWPLFTALGQVGRPVTTDVTLPGTPEVRLRCHAIASQTMPSDHRLPPQVTAVMSVQPGLDPDTRDPVPVGVACRICPRNDCAARREPSALSEGL